MAQNTKKDSKKKKKTSTISQIKQIFAFTYTEDKALPWYMAGAFFLPVLVALICCLVFKFGWLSWIMTMLLGIMVGLLLATITLTRRSDTVGYKKMDGRPGASAAVLSNISKAGFDFPQDPVWLDPKTKDAVWRGTGRSGIYLIGEGDYGRVMKAMDRQEDEIHRITRGSAIPIYKISVGRGDKQVPLEKLQKTVIRKKVKLTPTELDQLKARLKTLQMRNNALNMPKGMDPTKMHMSRRALRGK
ncbi:membrane protein [Bombiscardovia nodaiensis]|uniref:Membrane protein n=1 Tax=Bombiscardovia nodaiensis TaxID=2932181 RepID=A0ABN6S9C1_9BIFI|nr:membrane protein [Bombiscardovia nodaiensis]